MRCFCPATDGVFCYFFSSQCPAPYVWEQVVSVWGYCLTGRPTAGIVTQACVGESLPPELVAAIQSSNTHIDMIQATNEEANNQFQGLVYGTTFGFVGACIIAYSVYAVWTSRFRFGRAMRWPRRGQILARSARSVREPPHGAVPAPALELSLQPHVNPDIRHERVTPIQPISVKRLPTLPPEQIEKTSFPSTRLTRPKGRTNGAPIASADSTLPIG